MLRPLEPRSRYASRPPGDHVLGHQPKHGDPLFGTVVTQLRCKDQEPPKLLIQLLQAAEMTQLHPHLPPPHQQPSVQSQVKRGAEQFALRL